MSIIDRQIRKLENQLGVVDEDKRIRFVVCRADLGLALDQDRCIEILGEGGFLSDAPISCVNFLNIPKGMNAEETEGFLREHGAETSNFDKFTDTNPD